MDHYLLTARALTAAQQMAAVLGRSGIPVTIRRFTGGSGCGYALAVPSRHYKRAMNLLAEAGRRPVKVFFVSGGLRREVEQ